MKGAPRAADVAGRVSDLCLLLGMQRKLQLSPFSARAVCHKEVKRVYGQNARHLNHHTDDSLNQTRHTSANVGCEIWKGAVVLQALCQTA